MWDLRSDEVKEELYVTRMDTSWYIFVDGMSCLTHILVQGVTLDWCIYISQKCQNTRSIKQKSEEVIKVVQTFGHMAF